MEHTRCGSVLFSLSWGEALATIDSGHAVCVGYGCVNRQVLKDNIDDAEERLRQYNVGVDKFSKTLGMFAMRRQCGHMDRHVLTRALLCCQPHAQRLWCSRRPR